VSEILNRVAVSKKPMAVRGFESIQRYWDPAAGCWTAKILPGEYYVTANSEAISTVLGSCISACIRDPKLGVGGMNHFMLPDDGANRSGGWVTAGGAASTRYGTFAMESLINELQKLGARRDRFEVKLFGGGKILPAMSDVGLRNIAFAREFLATEGIPIVAQDVGDVVPRRVVYFPATGRVLVKHLRALDSRAVAHRESSYRERLGEQSAGNDVELFE
jgi:chemotaxis protein CheD